MKRSRSLQGPGRTTILRARLEALVEREGLSGIASDQLVERMLECVNETLAPMEEGERATPEPGCRDTNSGATGFSLPEDEEKASAFDPALSITDSYDFEPPPHFSVVQTAPFPPAADGRNRGNEASDQDSTHGEGGKSGAHPPRFRYEDQGPIGFGAMGEVRRVRDPVLNRTMAIKMLRAETYVRPADISRFISEAQVTAQLQHPGIVPVHELGRFPDGRYYFTMDEIRGRTLEAVIQEVHEASRGDDWQTAPSGWTFRRLIDTFHRVCDTVAFAHARGVIHRDLKPSNVMLGEYGEVLVMDWGLAKLIDQPVPSEKVEPVFSDPDRPIKADSAHTIQGLVAGTLAYMAPEQAAGDNRRIGPTSDVFALGAMLYEILAGRPHIIATSLHSAMNQLLNIPLVPPGRPVWDDPARNDEGPEGLEGEKQLPVPAALQEICMKAMARSPDERYPNARVLAEKVGEWLEDATRRERALKVLCKAETLGPEVQRLRNRAAELREKAAKYLEHIPTFAPVARKKHGWELEDQADEMERQAEVSEAEMLRLIQGALTIEPRLAEAREMLAAHFRALLDQAEARRQGAAAARHEASLRAYDTGRHRAYLEGWGAITLVTDPPTAEVTCYQYVLEDRRLVPRYLRSLGKTPIVTAPLNAGSYLLVLEAEGRVPVHYPVRIGREDHWDGVRPGDSSPFPIYLPRIHELEPDDVYVPAGMFQSGGDWQSEPTSLPYRQIWLSGFVIRRFPITNREYIAFLDDLVANNREEEALRHVPRERTIGPVQGVPVYGRNALNRFELRPDADGDLWEAEWPVCLVDWQGARAYALWLSENTGRPWRLPWELEWEKAARGTDGRYYPWGDFLDPTWCCVRESHEGPHLPARVTEFPSDSSPYGVRGLAGGVVDWCQDRFHPAGPTIPECGTGLFLPVEDLPDEPPRKVVRTVKGGAWSFFHRSARSTRHLGFSASLRDHAVGFRLAMTFPG